MGNEIRRDTSAEPKPARGGAQKFAILVVVLLLVTLCSEGCKSAAEDAASNLAAKHAAATSIRAAKETIATAALAAEPGSQELAEIQKSTSELDYATWLYAQGSVTQTGPYLDAKTKADEARRIAQGIADMVAAAEALAAKASSEGEAAVKGNGDPGHAIALYFSLYSNYPRTRQGRDAIKNAVRIVRKSSSGDPIDALHTMKTFCATCPGDVPATIYKLAAKYTRSAAGDFLYELATYAHDQKQWVRGMRETGVGGTLGDPNSGSPGDTGFITHIIRSLPALKTTRYHAVLALLRDCSRLSDRCDKIHYAVESNAGDSQTIYYSGHQVAEIDGLTTQMDTILVQARALLKNL